MANGLHSFTKKDNMKKAMYEEMAKWVSQAWKDMSVSSIKSDFSQAGIITPFANKEDCDVSDDKAEKDNDALDKENLQLFHSVTND